MNKKIIQLLLLFGLMIISLTACGATVGEVGGNEPAVISTPLPPTSTPIPSTEGADTETPLPLTSTPIASTENVDSSTDEAEGAMETAVPAPSTSESESNTDTEVKFLVTDTKQEFSFDNEGNVIHFPAEGEPLYGQDAQYVGLEPSFRDNGDGTVSDLVTALLWEKTPTFDTYQHEDAVSYCENLETGGYDNWRMPTIKELYSLADYRGELLLDDVSTPYIDATYFDFQYPAGRQYAGQYWSSTRYRVPPSSDGEDQMKYFGFNFADGHIKAYGTSYTFDGTPMEGAFAPGMYVRCVSGEENVYGVNQFVDNGDGTVTDTATGLMWQQTDDGQTRNWEEALAYAENLELAGYDDWRVPNAKELQSIVQYNKTAIPAIDEDFFTLTNPDSYFWTSTTHGDFKYQGVYIAFGPAWSIPVRSDSDEYIDEHGAGAQRSDPKTGDPDEYNNNLSSENAADLFRIYDYVLAVRNVSDQPIIQEDTGTLPTKTGTPVEAPTGQGSAPEGQSGAPEGQAPDLAAAATQLGITEQELMDALGPPPPDLEAAAATLGITVEELQNALGVGSERPASPSTEGGSVPSESNTYVVDTSASTVGWLGDKIIGEAHNGTVEISEGTLVVEDGALVSGSFVIDMTTITNQNLSGNDAARLVEHLMAEDFFGVDTYPTATLELLSTESLGNDQYAVTGDLTIKEITNPIEFVAEAVNENDVITASADVVFDRTLYDVIYKSGSIFSGLGDGAINDEVQITVELVATN